MTADELVAMGMARQVGPVSGRALREAAGLSVREAAAYLGVSPASLSRHERGLNRPKGRQAVEYGRLLGLWMAAGMGEGQP